MKTISAFAATLLLLAANTHAQRQLQCDEGENCSIKCYQQGMKNAENIFHRENLDTLQIDLNARVIKLESRGTADKPGPYDYFILGSEMSCTIERMRGMHD